MIRWAEFLMIIRNSAQPLRDIRCFLCDLCERQDPSVGPFPGGIAQAFYGGVPGFITQKVMEILDRDLSRITSKFMEAYCKI